MEELQRQITEITRRLDALDGRVPASLVADVEGLARLVSEAAVKADVAVPGTPTSNGYIPFRINGQRVNLMTTS